MCIFVCVWSAFLLLLLFIAIFVFVCKIIRNFHERSFTFPIPRGGGSSSSSSSSSNSSRIGDIGGSGGSII